MLRNPCPRCYSDGTVTLTQDALQVVHFQCPRGHMWSATMEDVQRHTRWVGIIGRVGQGKIRQGEQ